MTRWFFPVAPSPGRLPLRVAHAIAGFEPARWAAQLPVRFRSPPPCSLHVYGEIADAPVNLCALCLRAVGWKR